MLARAWVLVVGLMAGLPARSCPGKDDVSLLVHNPLAGRASSRGLPRRPAG